MSGRVILSLPIHKRQPVGNFSQVFEMAFRQAYLPMVEALERHPRIRLAMHYSGPLLDWLEGSQREFVPRVGALVARGQVELLSGGYYEPILAIIPDADKDGQIRMMTDYLKRRFHARATGLWLAERVWEPHLAKPLAAAGVEYLIVDDTHFTAAGVREEQLTGYFVTEEQGATVKVFPSRKRLRYLIPWQSPDDVLAYLRTFLRPVPGKVSGDQHHVPAHAPHQPQSARAARGVAAAPGTRRSVGRRMQLSLLAWRVRRYLPAAHPARDLRAPHCRRRTGRTEPTRRRDDRRPRRRRRARRRTGFAGHAAGCRSRRGRWGGGVALAGRGHQPHEHGGAPAAGR